MTGNELKALRAKLGLTQTEMANRLGVTRDAIARIEGGTNNMSKLLHNHVQLVFNTHESKRLADLQQKALQEERDPMPRKRKRRTSKIV